MVMRCLLTGLLASISFAADIPITLVGSTQTQIVIQFDCDRSLCLHDRRDR